jgi:drug/metabolite transporter (DMT)-like permease
VPPRAQVAVAIVLWGLSFVATKAALREISPLTLIFTRFALGTALLVGLLAATGRPLVPPRERWPHLALLGFVGVFVHHLMQSYALTRTSAVRTGWLIGLIPLWASLLSALLGRERFGALKVGGIALGFAGALVVVSGGRPGAAAFAAPATLGDALILASTLNWALYTNLGHGTIRALGSLRATAGAMFLGWLMLAPLFVRAAGWREYAALSAGGWGAVLFLGLGCSGLAYLCWYGALERIPVSKVAVFQYVQPLVTQAAAVAMLGEPLHAATVAGGALVLAGVALVQRAPDAAARRTTEGEPG